MDFLLSRHSPVCGVCNKISAYSYCCKLNWMHGLWLQHWATAIPRSMVINTRKLWGVTKKVQLITMGTLITMSFQMVLISWVYIWPQNRPKRSLSNLSWNFWVFPVTSSSRNGKQKGGECFCFGNFLALFVLPSLLCAHSHQERENWDKPSLVLITH